MKEELYYLLQSQSEGSLTLPDILLNLVVAAILGGMIFAAYRSTHSGTVYSARFNVSLVMTVLVTTTVMCVIGNNISLSLGMVGALSIVRFRTAIKDPRDTIFIFWSVAVGVCCGVCDYIIALMGTVFIFLFLVLFGFVKDVNRVLIVVRGEDNALSEASKVIDESFSNKAVRRVYTVEPSGSGEVIYEVTAKILKKISKKNGKLEDKLRTIKGTSSVSVMCQEDEIAG
ncbi:MAG: DUF4956 domain-containing protein [Lachnospiraceae bacterium]|nr:DUF4956 domain-containing protein [Lachnospiraceae bacterium]